MNADAVAELLHARIGLESQSLGAGVLANIVGQRMRALGLTDLKGYADRLAGSSAEFDALVEDVVVPETWFFRGGEVFAFLADHVRKKAATAPAATVRVLSAPCSTGEEAYSLAIALTEAGVPRQRWTVDGIDVSARSLEQARQARYGKSSFRDTSDNVRRRYFHKEEGGWIIEAALRGLVRFRQGNLLDPRLLAEEGPFDLIFCRNLLIYLHAAARGQVLANLDRLLSADGLLCMGHAEPWSLIETRFQATGPMGCFLFVRKQSPGERGRVSAPSIAALGALTRPRSPNERISRAALIISAGTGVPPVETNLLAKARVQADAGALDEALRNCRAHLSAVEPSADAYSLLGVIHQARKERERAADCFRKALYLDPRHEEALLHLMLLHQEDGDDAAAGRLRRRLGRQSAGGDA